VYEGFDALLSLQMKNI